MFFMLQWLLILHERDWHTHLNGCLSNTRYDMAKDTLSSSKWSLVEFAPRSKTSESSVMGLKFASNWMAL